jgi:hypothetical protein
MPNRIKVVFDLDVEDGYPPVASEGLWCQKSEAGEYVVDNVPFYVVGVSLGDTVSASLEDGNYFCDGILSGGGHSTIRVVFFDANVVDAVRAGLELLQCAWESMKVGTFTAVDVPPEADYDQVLAYLQKFSDERALEFEESCIQHS